MLAPEDWNTVLRLDQDGVTDLDSDADRFSGSIRTVLLNHLIWLLIEQDRIEEHKDDVVRRLGDQIAGRHLLPLMSNSRLDQVAARGPESTSDSELLHLMLNPIDQLRLWNRMESGAAAAERHPESTPEDTDVPAPEASSPQAGIARDSNVSNENEISADDLYSRTLSFSKADPSRDALSAPQSLTVVCRVRYSGGETTVVLDPANNKLRLADSIIPNPIEIKAGDHTIPVVQVGDQWRLQGHTRRLTRILQQSGDCELVLND